MPRDSLIDKASGIPPDSSRTKFALREISRPAVNLTKRHRQFPILLTLRSHVIELGATVISVEGHPDDQAVFAEGLASLMRLCR
jgi:hypothetical protein